MKVAFFALLVWTCLIGEASAQLLDDILFDTNANGDVVATIKLNNMVQYLRHVPDHHGQHLEISFSVMVDRFAVNQQWQDYETRKSPPSDLIPAFTVVARDMATNPTLVVDFIRPADYNVRIGDNRRSLIITIKSDKASAPNEKPDPVKKQPAEVATVAAVTPIPAPVLPAADLSGPPEHAKIIERIDVVPRKNDAEITVRFSKKILYLSDVTLNDGSDLRVFLRLIAPNLYESDLDQEVVSSLKTERVPDVRVIYPELIHGMLMSFSVPTKTAVHPGTDDQSIVVIVPLLPPVAHPAPLQVIAAVPPPAAPKDIPTTPAVPAVIPAAPVVSTLVPAAPVVPAFVPAAPAVPVVVPAAPVVVPVDSVAANSIAPKSPQSDQDSETDIQAQAFMANGRDALQAGQPGAAIEYFNKALLLPPNKYSQDALELIGVAREAAGQKFRAQREYETYLNLYSSGEGVDRVKDRLAKLLAGDSIARSLQSAKSAEVVDVSQLGATDKKGFQTVSNGSISSNYYRGLSQTVVSGLAIGSLTDQNMLITNVTASVRSHDERYDNRVFFQDTYDKNFLPAMGSQIGPNILGSAYYELHDRETNLSTRIGRQSPEGSGIMGRFDGISAGYGITSDWQLTSATGQLVDYLTGSKPVFYSVDLALRNNRNWGGNIYLINQLTNGLTDRRSVGGDMRYFDENKSVFALLDYDIYFHALNWASLQVTANGAPGTTYSLNMDHRSSPSLSLSNVMIGSQSTTTTLLQNGYTIDNLKALALLRTGTVDSAVLSVNTQVAEKWQTGSDVFFSKSAALPESGTNVPGSLNGYVPPTPSTGANYGINGRLIGNGIFFDHDISVLSAGYTGSAMLKGENLTFSNHSNLTEKWALDSSFQVSLQSSYDLTTGSQTGKLTTISPAFRLNYQMMNNVYLVCQYGVDMVTNNPTSGQSSKTTRNYFSFGGFWNF